MALCIIITVCGLKQINKLSKLLVPVTTNSSCRIESNRVNENLRRQSHHYSQK